MQKSRYKYTHNVISKTHIAVFLRESTISYILQGENRLLFYAANMFCAAIYFDDFNFHLSQ